MHLLLGVLLCMGVHRISLLHFDLACCYLPSGLRLFVLVFKLFCRYIGGERQWARHSALYPSIWQTGSDAVQHNV